MKENIWKPSKTFVKEIINFPGSNFNSLYGRKTIPDSDYIFLYDEGLEKRPYPYLIGEDKRSTGEIWKSIEPVIADRAKEMLENDTIRQYWSDEKDYVGKLKRCYIFLAKELLLPKKFKKEVDKHKEGQKKEPYMSIEDSVLSGKFFAEHVQEELFEKKLACILEKEGTKLGNRTVVDVKMSGHTISYPQTIELMEKTIGILKDQNYKLENMQLSGFCPYADIDKLVKSEVMFVGEVKLIEPLLPCGKTSRQRNHEWEKIHKKYDEERKCGLHKTYTRSGIDEEERRFTRYITPSPRMPCGFIKGRKECAPGWCDDYSRGELVKKESSKENGNFLNKKQTKVVNDVASFVSRLYNSFDMLKEKESSYR